MMCEKFGRTPPAQLQELNIEPKYSNFTLTGTYVTSDADALTPQVFIQNADKGCTNSMTCLQRETGTVSRFFQAVGSALPASICALAERHVGDHSFDLLNEETFRRVQAA